MEKLKVGIVGATGMVGQRFVLLLEKHPYFEISCVIAGPRSAGRTYAEAVDGRWKMKTPIPASVKDMTITQTEQHEDENLAKLANNVAYIADVLRDMKAQQAGNPQKNDAE